MPGMRFVATLVLLVFAAPARAAFLDCLFIDSFDGELASAPAAWRGNLSVHNCARRTVVPAARPPMPLLSWSPTLAVTAQAWAARCTWAHSGTPGLGENLYAAAPPRAVQTDAALSWAREQPWYDYASNSCQPGRICGHYTQMVWRNSRDIGCAINDCSTGSPFSGFPNWTIVVCNYSPPGNWLGQRPY